MTDQTKKVLVIGVGLLLALVFAGLWIGSAISWPSDPTWWAELKPEERDGLILFAVIISWAGQSRCKCSG